MPMPLQPRLRAALRVLLSHYVANGAAAALGLLVISSLMHLLGGSAAASAATVGAIVAIPPDIPAPRRGKLLHMLPAPLLALPLFFVVQRLHGEPWLLGLLIVPASFFAFLAMAWGKRGAPVAIAAVLALVFSMAVPAPAGGDGWQSALSSSFYFGLGALLYLPWGVLANRLLNGRYRVQMIADVLLSQAALMRLQALQFTPMLALGERANPLMGGLLLRQAALADQLQSARDIVLESPGSARQQQLAGMLLCALEMRDHLLASALDLEGLRTQPELAQALSRQRGVLVALAAQLERLADALLLGQMPAAFESLRAGLELPPLPPGAGFTPARLAQALSHRIGHIHDEAARLTALARGETTPDLALVRVYWQMFVSPTGWGWKPFFGLWRWRAAPLRHAMRAALAIGAGYALSQLLPWREHAYWIVLTIIVVLRGSLAQTLERRNERVAGTLLGCLLASVVLAAELPHWALLACVTVAQAVAHAFTLQRYLFTAIAATVLGLVQAHLLGAGGSPGFVLLERMADTLIGAGIAWAFAYVLPSWERQQIPALVARTLAAQTRHAREALGLGQLQAVDNHPELAWRLARREAYDSLGALVQATARAWKEPRAVRPPLAPLERMQVHCYQLLAQLTAVKSMLLLRRGHLRGEDVQAPLQEAAERLEAVLTGAAVAAAPEPPWDGEAVPQSLPPLVEADLAPWLLRRLRLAEGLAQQLRSEAMAVVTPLRGG
ncbi:FUSC family protein [Alicycliphilus denitrificans]|uniref:FUSC family protein n=1 Tax=Alicycliphilus denitrificans TaxID=179636 RepID=UPI00384AF46B